MLKILWRIYCTERTCSHHERLAVSDNNLVYSFYIFIYASIQYSSLSSLSSSSYLAYPYLYLLIFLIFIFLILIFIFLSSSSLSLSLSSYLPYLYLLFELHVRLHSHIFLPINCKMRLFHADTPSYGFHSEMILKRIYTHI